MVIYTLISLIIGILAINEFITKKKSNILLYSSVILFLWLIVAFRECGFDYENYRYIGKYLSSSYWKNNAEYFRIEIGYSYLSFLLGNYRTTIIFMATITLSCYAFFIYKRSSYPIFSIYLLLVTLIYSSIMGQYRQAFAVGLFFVALLFYKYNKIIFITLILIASTFHLSAIIAFIIFLIPRHEISNKTYLKLFLLALMSNLLAKMSFIQLSRYLPEILLRRIDAYLLSEEGMTTGLNITMIFKLFTLGIFIYNKTIISKFKDGYFFLNIYFLSSFMYLGLGFLPQLANRGSLYFYSLEYILAAMIIHRTQKYRFLYFSFFMLVSIYRQIAFFNGLGHQDYIPYKSSIFSHFIL